MAVQYAFSQITTQGLKLAVDAADPLSYPGSGTTWTDVTGNGFTGTVSSSISFVTTNRGALYSANSSSAVTFSGSAVNFGSDSFTVEMAFSPQVINGQHFLFSKNSGSFPNFGAFLTGSGGSGRLVTFYNVSSTVSCSASTPTGSFITGSNYIVDVTYIPSQLTTAVYSNSTFVTQSAANGTGSLSTSASLFLLNNSTSSNAGSVANLYSFKVYNSYLGSSSIRKNYNAQAARFGLPLASYIPPAPLLLDIYPGVTAVYSLRKLRTTYLGAAIQVRRSSDNATSDIGFDVNGNLDTATLLNFCGVGNGFVTSWYDQSGNGLNATQSIAVNQPQIVSSGTTVTLNNKPAIQFDNTNDFLKTVNTNNFYFDNKFYIVHVNSFITYGDYDIVLNTAADGNANNGWWIEYGTARGFTMYSNNSSRLEDNVQSLTSLSTNTQRIFTIYQNNSGMKGFFNNTEFGSSLYTGTIGQTSRPLSISSVEGAYFTNMNLQEIIIYSSDQSTNRTAIESNINSYYSIY